MTQQTPGNSAGAQRGAQVVIALSSIVLLGCWGLASMTGSLAVYAVGWVAAVGAASATAVLYRMWTAGKPDLHARTQTMTLGLVGWLIVIGLGMTLFKSAASVFVETTLENLNWAIWLLPILILPGILAWWYARRAGKQHDDPALKRNATQHLATVISLAIAEAGIVYAHANDGARWADVLAGVFAVGAGMAWSWLMLWRRIASSPAARGHEDTIDPALSGHAREALEAAKDQGQLIDYDRLAIEPSPAGTRISVRLHLDGGQALDVARETARQVERALETLLPAGTVITLLEPAAGAMTPPPPQAPPADPHPAPPDNPEPGDDRNIDPSRSG